MTQPFAPARLALLIASCVVASAATAAPITLTLTPASPETTNTVKANSTTGAPGFGNSSFQEKSNGKSEIYITPAELFGTTVTIGQIASISYWTDKTPGSSTARDQFNNAPSPDVDWSLYLYTNKQTGDSSFYHTRLTAEPLYSNGTYASNVWHQWSTNDPSNPLRFYDQARDGNIQGTNTDPTLSDLQNNGNPYTFTGANAGPGAVGTTYDPELIQYFSLQTGSAWAQGFTGVVDGLTITLTDGRVAAVDLSDGTLAAAVVPEPESMTLLFIGLAGALGLSRRRRRAA